jgi:CRISPR-associated protein Csd1
MCYVTGKEMILTEKHPSKIRHGGDKAKLISFNDKEGFTYRGRFENGEQACKVSFDVSQKAHSVLKWLLDARRKQAYFNDGQVIVAWSVQSGLIPNTFQSTYDLFKEYDVLELGHEISDGDFQEKYSGDLGFNFSKNLALRMKGINSPLKEEDDIVIMGVNSATQGRLSVIYYREFKGGELIDRVEKWHQKYCWHNNDKGFNFFGAPSASDIVEAAYGKKCDDKLKKASIEKILPCIAEGKSLPDEFMTNAFRRACNPVAFKEYWDWQKTLRTACALFKGKIYKEDYSMGLDKTSKDRSYLYGRLLAVADYAEGNALKAANENRETNAKRFMHDIARKPFSKWEILHKKLSVYMKKLLRKPHYNTYQKVDEMFIEIKDKFTLDEYSKNERLNGNFLLGYYHQIQDLFTKKDAKDSTEENNQQ